MKNGRLRSLLLDYSAREHESLRGDDDERKYTAVECRLTESDGCLLAGRQLSFGGTDLSARQSVAAKTLDARAHQTSPIGPLGNDSGTEFHLCPSESDHQTGRPGYGLYVRARPWRSRGRGERLSRGYLQRGVSGRESGRRRHEAPVSAVFLPRRNPESCRARDAGL